MVKWSPNNKTLALLGLVVIGLAFPTYQTVAGESVIGVEEVVSVVIPERGPASLPPTPTLHFESVDVGCKKVLPAIKANGHYLQMKGQFCRGKNLVIVNKSNGYTASVFELNQDRYQTDMIQLKKGENELQIRYQDHRGQMKEYKMRVSTSHI